MEGVLIPRGFLGTITPVEKFCWVQKKIVRQCNEAGVPCILGSEFLDSVIRTAQPSRAEVTDIYTAVMNGADAILLN